MYEDFRKKGSLEEAIKRIQQINEYIFEADPQGGMLNDDEAEADTQNQNPEPEMAMGDETPNNEQGPEMDQEVPGNPSQDNQMPVDNDSQEGQSMSQDGQIPEPAMDGAEGTQTEPMEPGDEVIDVDELTDKQEKTEEKLDGVDDKLTSLANVLDKFMEVLNNNDAKIDDLRREFERRNPTEEEKTEIRTGQGGPYSENPAEAWRKLDSRMKEGNLIAPDKEKVYTITADDIQGGNDQEIARSMDAYPTDLMSYFA